MRKYLGRWLLGVCLLVLSLGMTVSAEEAAILSGVKIDRLDVSGMTREEAISALEAYEEKLGDEVLSLKIGDTVLDANISDFGMTWSNEEIVDQALGLGRTGNIVRRYKDQKDLQKDGKVFPLNWKADEKLVRAYVEETCTKYDKDAQNASLTRENGAFEFVAGTQGQELDVNASVSRIMDYLENSWTSGSGQEALELPTKVTQPEGSAEELAHVKDLLGTYTTSFSTSNKNRQLNVNTGAEKFNGMVVYPGEEISAYEVVSPFTTENGYAMAGSYLNGEVVDSMGGGICQVTTTLYNAVIRAELEVTERSPHSMTVNYVPEAGDAAIAGTYKDLKFKNSLEYPIYIEGYTTPDKKITFSIYGKETRDSSREISFESVIVSETPPTTVLTDSPGQPLGYKSASKGRVGIVAELYKVVKVNGVETERIKINKSTYKGGNRVVTYGTAGDPVLSENLRAAIALQDEALADANIAALLPPPVQ